MIPATSTNGDSGGVIIVHGKSSNSLDQANTGLTNGAKREIYISAKYYSPDKLNKLLRRMISHNEISPKKAQKIMQRYSDGRGIDLYA